MEVLIRLLLRQLRAKSLPPSETRLCSSSSVDFICGTDPPPPPLLQFLLPLLSCSFSLLQDSKQAAPLQDSRQQQGQHAEQRDRGSCPRPWPWAGEQQRHQAVRLRHWGHFRRCRCFGGRRYSSAPILQVLQAGESTASAEDPPLQVPTGGGNQLSVHHLHCRFPPPRARGSAPHVRARLPPPLPPGGGGGAEPTLPALLGSSAVKV
ncbi:uncharacterized protein [Triticum aestivum]|uniref:uncharacterized protein isoform X1 n=1 Tax=Triticum aestivum TaxID=4565 RepID=UPI001D02BCCB|nr:uncharacterized protein LOC123138331 isoform X1 [Triticum aestivum]